ncbi:heavy metal-binding domain-containing protein [Mucilaginibacter sp. dw_454]|uniref:heavy metal-binding domain-containing protein n=1 Tax=Mucilaginibacter sp. dw_454 TaxID=2720079 RepID=UPI001BD50448|nr:heavy metal-binding domain-containing protein [Mucilaginibacter sp. dw_454]
MRSVLIALAFLGMGLTSCSNATKDKSTTKKHYKYYCIMHPDLGSDKPGVCPKCGMQLVERDTDK